MLIYENVESIHLKFINFNFYYFTIRIYGNMELKDSIKKLADTYGEELINIRRHLHAHPELSFEEVETANYISSVLTSY